MICPQLLIELELEPNDVTILAAVRDAFSKSNIPIPVDVLDWAQFSESFRCSILSDKVIFRNSGPAAEAAGDSNVV